MDNLYSITINNQSAHSDYLMIFQQDPSSLSPDAMALAWFSQFSNPSSVNTFNWEVIWGFSWAVTGELAAGITYSASQVTSANAPNETTLSYNGAYEFLDPTAGPNPDLLYLVEDGTIPVDSAASVGITMYGHTVFATQATPNTNLTFTPEPQYFLAYGNYSQGLVLDVSTINNPIQLPFGVGVYSLAVTLNADDSWGPVTTVAQANERILQAARQTPQRRAAR